MAEQAENTRELTPVSAEELHEMASVLAHFSERYESLASTMTQRGVKLIPTANAKTYSASIEHIRRHCNKAFEGLDSVIMGTMSQEEIDKIAQALSDASKRVKEARKKKKPNT